MRLKDLLVPSSVLAASLLLLVPDDARACSPGGCRTGVLVPSGGDVPASLPAVLWSPERDFFSSEPIPIDPTQIELVQLTANGEVPVQATATVREDGLYLIAPAAPLLPDADYALRAGQFCSLAPPEPWPTTATLHTTSAAPLPTTLGKLSVYAVKQGPLNVGTVSGGCIATITAASARIELGLAADAAPWRNVLMYQTIVDGVPWQGSSGPSDFSLGGSWQGRGKDLVYTACENSGEPFGVVGLSPGTHSVKMLATLPGSDVALETEELSFELTCAPPEPPPPEVTLDPENATAECNVAAPGSGAQASWAAGAIAVALAAMGARSRRRGRA
ncbi:hypothetical protein [Polyangium aurulentum]|uniref:hypothetical protein n=1 Tax=Polyangium aurulentum TaxID=2567896 RepID=UPI0010AEB9F3|nr:hypothetical protein [Polyangium aurulentum]UQA62233.1 hypothetical protein E8A73_017885 [Polyangium aurulentum]